ncbi:capsule assembly Wzi family protein [Belliella kenyensis]|uniref:Capsule assembly Wzi family protein n=1 Tax=Belliella kenyensis TaxID=1472724 RepID=A0ABV8EPA7_9BACT|nr:capsule assembly Wzi family protein [Belliella kenyensis]MCH7401593.1 capsule assembly Wzi family protein [Belliella kenyensis]MDN3603127.1 capsule assembly Wzi family protein [Belliella kenyensis]
MKNILSIKVFLILLLFAFENTAQTLPFNTLGLEDYLRRKQLLGEIDSHSSFSIRPLYPAQAFDTYTGLDLDGDLQDFDTSLLNSKFGKNNKGTLLMMPFTMLNQYNSDLTFGINNGAMIPNNGLQTLMSAGAFIKYGIFSLQIQPEVVIAQNNDFIGFPIEHQSTILYYYEYLNRIDMPERFGTGSYFRLLPGQSSIRVNPGDYSFGISTENIWWGPGRRSSLLMSNNAPGFLHFTANTRKPIDTKVGFFEGQIIAGHLNSTNYELPHQDYVFQNNNVFIPKRENGDRYLSGLILTYQPVWIPGLSLGYASTSHMYREDMDEFKDYLPVFNGEKRMSSIENPKRDQRQQFSSGFFRWMSPRGHFEFYGEYGTNGNSRRLNEFIVTPERNRAFTLGFSNLFSLKNQDQYIQLSAEMTQSGQAIRESIQNMDTWYIHDHVRHGYTHQGQVLGMGYGPAANVNWLEVAWVKRYNRVGFQFERIVYNNDFYYFRMEGSQDWRNKYMDLVPGLFTDLKVKNLLLSGSIQYINTFNYKWYLENDPNFYFVPGDDRKNIMAKIGVSYILK